VTANPHVIDMPQRRAIARHAGTTVLVVSALPMMIFYLALAVAGLHAALFATVGWYYAGMLVRVARHKPVLGAALLGAALLTVRTMVTFLTGSTLIYFLQPVAGTVATATAFAATALAGRPILDRLAHEFCPLPTDLSHRLRQRRFFAHLSVVWSLTYFVNAAGTVWLLTSSSIGGFIVLKSILSPALSGVAAVASYTLFRLALHREGVRIRWGHRVACPASAAVYGQVDSLTVGCGSPAAKLEDRSADLPDRGVQILHDLVEPASLRHVPQS
jgi:uncharacterized membrane protein